MWMGGGGEICWYAGCGGEAHLPMQRKGVGRHAIVPTLLVLLPLLLFPTFFASLCGRVYVLLRCLSSAQESPPPVEGGEQPSKKKRLSKLNRGEGKGIRKNKVKSV
jgi:hypothetical protein